MRDGIRMEGSISASMAIHGRIVNPFANESVDILEAIYGRARHVTYGFGAR